MPEIFLALGIHNEHISTKMKRFFHFKMSISLIHRNKLSNSDAPTDLNNTDNLNIKILYSLNILTITGLIWCSLWELTLKIWVPITSFRSNRIIKALSNHLEFTPVPNPLNHLATMCAALYTVLSFPEEKETNYISQDSVVTMSCHIIWILPVPADFLKCGCRMKQEEVIAVWIKHPLCKQCPKVSASSRVAPCI